MNPGPTVARIEIGSGNAGVKKTLAVMRRVVLEYRQNPVIIGTAQRVLASVPNKNWNAEIRALHEFVRDRVRYTLDVNAVEVLQTPTRLLQTLQGDCDDKSLLLATLLEASGHPARFVAVGFDGVNLSHVLVEARNGADWLPLETTEPVPAGWYPPNVNTHYVVNV